MVHANPSRKNHGHHQLARLCRAEVMVTRPPSAFRVDVMVTRPTWQINRAPAREFSTTSKHLQTAPFQANPLKNHRRIAKAACG